MVLFWFLGVGFFIFFLSCCYLIQDFKTLMIFSFNYCKLFTEELYQTKALPE